MRWRELKNDLQQDLTNIIIASPWVVHENDGSVAKSQQVVSDMIHAILKLGYERGSWQILNACRRSNARFQRHSFSKGTSSNVDIHSRVRYDDNNQLVKFIPPYSTFELDHEEASITNLILMWDKDERFLLIFIQKQNSIGRNHSSSTVIQWQESTIDE